MTDTPEHTPDSRVCFYDCGRPAPECECKRGMAQASVPPDLQDLIRRAASHKMTPEEIRAQKVSFVYGQLQDAAPEVTKEQIAAELDRMEGRAEPAPDLVERVAQLTADHCGADSVESWEREFARAVVALVLEEAVEARADPLMPWYYSSDTELGFSMGIGAKTAAIRALLPEAKP